MNQEEDGFTLLEVAIALSLVGLMFGGGLMLVRNLVEQRMRQEAVDYLSEVKGALISYAKVNKRMPWADSDLDGKENVSASGYLPYVTLGVKPVDPWGRQVRYRVANFNAYGEGPPLNLSTKCSNLFQNPGVSFSVWENGPAGGAAFGISAIVVSGGARNADGFGAGADAVFDTMSGGSNYTPTDNYVSSIPSATFDDVTVYLTRLDIARALGCPDPGGSLPVGPATPAFE